MPDFCSTNIFDAGSTSIQHRVVLILSQAQQTRYTHPVLVKCWASVCDVGPALNQHRPSISKSDVASRIAAWRRPRQAQDQCWVSAIPTSTTLAQPRPNIGSVSCILGRDCRGAATTLCPSAATSLAQQTRKVSQCWFNVEPPSTTLTQHWNNTASMSRVRWGGIGAALLRRFADPRRR